MTSSQKERVAEAFDSLITVFEEVRTQRGCSKEAKRLDVIIGKLENLLFIAKEKE